MDARSEDGRAGTNPPEPERAPRAVVFGEVLYDRFPDGTRVLGGAPFNVAWHLCALGGDPLLLSAVGRDDEGRAILDQMESWGLDTRGVALDRERPTGRVEVGADGGTPSFRIPPDQAWDRIPVPGDSDLLDPARSGLVYHGTLALRSAEGWSALDAARAEGRVPSFVDLNLRPPWWSREIVDRCLAHARWVKLNHAELSELTGRDASSPGACADAARRLRDSCGAEVVVVTRGGEGALLLEGDEVVHAEAPAVDDLVDTVGAGDALSAVLIHGILSGWPLARALERATVFAAETCRFLGATTTDLAAYESHLRRWVHDPAAPAAEPAHGSLYVMSLSVHGLVRGREIELGRDPDTGGQVSYVVDQARALANHPRVERVDLVTRLIRDRGVDPSYAEEVEELAEGARIVRIPFGPRRYLRKESLWPHLDGLLDQLTRYVRQQGRVPDVVHSHYADAGYVGAQLAKLLGVPFAFTGHSLGRVKLERLLADGMEAETIEERYHIARRIEAEEQALEAAALVVASTNQEVREQYEAYDNYLPERMEVVPPGVDLTRFSPPSRFWGKPPISREVERFLVHPDRPMVLALARADDRKNFGGLIRAFAAVPELRERANLVLVAGNRDDVAEMEPATRRVLTRILLLVDRFDLYGSVAYPKRHRPDDVPDLYRLAARTRGVFANPALTEPFGLTLIEAAASGLPVVATHDGGPRDIVGVLDNGLLADPLDPEALGGAIRDALADRRRWAVWAKNGVSRVHRHFSWRSHARRYVEHVERLAVEAVPPAPYRSASTRLPRMDRMLVTDLDGTLVGDADAVTALRERLDGAGSGVGLGVATGRTLERALEVLDALDFPEPDVLITASGGQLHYGKRLIRDRSWERQIHHRWDPDGVRAALSVVPGAEPDRSASVATRLRFHVDPDTAPDASRIRAALRRAGLRVTVLMDRARHLDVLPVRASPGLAIRFFCFKWNLPPERLLVAGDSGNDADMLSGDTLGVVVANHDPELDTLRGHPRIHFARGAHAWGIIEGLERYDFLHEIRIPEDEPG